MEDRIYISHLFCDSSNKWHIQTNDEHSKGVAELAASFAESIGLKDLGYAMGILHDKGKESDSFQSYIRTVSGYDPQRNAPSQVRHAYVGAVLAKKCFSPLADVITNQIAGHHRGLYDYRDLKPELDLDIPEGVDTDVPKSLLPDECVSALKGLSANEFHHIWRFLYSCLVDADFLDTERFMDISTNRLRGCNVTFEDLKSKLQSKLDSFADAPDTPVNRIRKAVQNECLKASTLPSGFFSLTVPTGGGKTISSVVWAVNHAIANGMKRIIIAIPYTSIIVQTAAVLKGIFGEENVLEHHSNVEYDGIKDYRLRQRMKLSSENWDYPIIVTTNVQLFESMFSNKPSVCRKLHNIADSVIILDEVQTLSTDFLQPIVDSLKTYQKFCNVSVLFTTASQPILSWVKTGCNPKVVFKGVDKVFEIIPDGMNLHEKLKRVELNIEDSGNTYDEIAQRLSSYNRVLCIVNTRKDAKELYDRLPKEGITLHLSRMMCPKHIKDTIAKLKAVLADQNSGTIRVIATQLIEAGVDIDFPVVFRQEAGLDSVLQAAGRCNREGKLSMGETFVFSLSKERPLPSGFMQVTNNARLGLGKNREWFAPETMTDYFSQLYSRAETFDKNQIKSILYEPKNMQFERASNEFQLIEEKGTSVVVNWEDSLNLIERLKSEGPSYNLMKKLSQYSVTIRDPDFKKLKKAGLIQEPIESVYVLPDREQYDENVGLLTENHWLEEMLIV